MTKEILSQLRQSLWDVRDGNTLIQKIHRDNFFLLLAETDQARANAVVTPMYQAQCHDVLAPNDGLAFLIQALSDNGRGHRLIGVDLLALHAVLDLAERELAATEAAEKEAAEKAAQEAAQEAAEASH